MSGLSQAQQQEIIAALQSRGVRLPCPRCGSSQFEVLDGYFNQTAQPHLQGLVIGGPSVPSAVVVCNHCGFMSQHALGVLGLLPKQLVAK